MFSHEEWRDLRKATAHLGKATAVLLYEIGKLALYMAILTFLVLVLFG